jgi:purine nucleoside phosphorylase
LAIVTNLGCGLGTEELNHQEVVDLMEERGEVATKILLEAARTLG